MSSKALALLTEGVSAWSISRVADRLVNGNEASVCPLADGIAAGRSPFIQSYKKLLSQRKWIAIKSDMAKGLGFRTAKVERIWWQAWNDWFQPHCRLTTKNYQSQQLVALTFVV